MKSLAVKQKKILLGVAGAITLGMIGAVIYRPQTYEEYVAKKRGISQKEVQKVVSGPQTAVENFLNTSLSDNPTEALEFLETQDNGLSSVDVIKKFLDIEIPLSFGYQIKDATFNSTTGMVLVDLITPAGALEKEINVENTDGQWKLTSVINRNNNQSLFSTSDGAITISIPQNIFSEKKVTEAGDAFTFYNAEGTLQIVLLVTKEDASELFAQMIDCNTGKCSKKDINGNTFDVFELSDQATNQSAFTAKAQKDGLYFTIMGVAQSPEDLEKIKSIIGTVKI
ncbi:MAG: hypothetical protein WC243_01650 [Patescibacteria group bacterium]